MGPGAAPVTSRDGGNDAAAGQTGPASKTCEPDAGGRLVCDASTVSGVPWGSPITVGTGAGAPPAPTGGSIVSGDYQLVSETMYGAFPIDVAGESPGDQTQSVIHVAGDVINQLYRVISQGGSGAGNSAECTPGLSIGPDMLCTGGHWEAMHPVFFCPER